MKVLIVLAVIVGLVHSWLGWTGIGLLVGAFALLVVLLAGSGGRKGRAAPAPTKLAPANPLGTGSALRDAAVVGAAVVGTVAVVNALTDPQDEDKALDVASSVTDADVDVDLDLDL